MGVKEAEHGKNTILLYIVIGLIKQILFFRKGYFLAICKRSSSFDELCSYPFAVKAKYKNQMEFEDIPASEEEEVVVAEPEPEPESVNILPEPESTEDALT